MGNQGDARVIYFTRLQEGELCRLLVYAKENIPAQVHKEIRKELEDGHS